MKVSAEWVILGHGRASDDAYAGPGTYAEIEELCFSWNESQTAREQRGEASRGSLQRFYIKRAA
jgi:hypothetical protein